MDFAGTLFALQMVQGINSIGQGFAQAGEDRYNASVFTNQADALGVQGNIEQGQYARKAGQLLSTQTADVAGKGLDPTGSAAAVMLSSQTQIETDAAIARYNNTMAINQANQKAKMLKQQAGQDEFSGFSSAFSDLLKGGAEAYAYGGNNSLNLPGGNSSLPYSNSPLSVYGRS